MKAKGRETRLAVYSLMITRPGIKIREIAEVMDANPTNIGRHVKMIREGWRPDPKPAPRG